MGFAYGVAASLIFITPRNGKIISGNKAVTGTGAPSEIHQIIIHAATANTLPALGEIKSGLTSVVIKMKASGPAIKPTCFTMG